MLYVSIVMPYRVAFNYNNNDFKDVWSILELIINIIFLLDIILTFFTAIYDNIN